MPIIKRCPVSCGSQTLHSLVGLFYNVNTGRRSVGYGAQQLRPLLGAAYRGWNQRGRDPNGDYQGDGRIYKGETIIFSDADEEGNGALLEELIAKYKLGTVVKTSTRNPNTSRRITTYLWVYNGEQIPAEKA